jgi:hypothetical protein
MEKKKKKKNFLSLPAISAHTEMGAPVRRRVKANPIALSAFVYLDLPS